MNAMKRKLMAMLGLQKQEPAEPDYLTFTAQENNSSVTLNKIGSPVTDVTLEYRINDGSWTSYNYGDTIDLNNGYYVKFRKANDGVVTRLGNSNSAYYQFVITGLIAGSGNIMSLLDKTCNSKSIDSFCFYNLFKGCTSLTEVPILGFDTILGQAACDYMFYGCTNIVDGPELLPTVAKNYCYEAMFYGCTKLESVTIHLETIATSWSNSWLKNVAASGRLTCPQSLTLSSGISGLPDGWTRYNLDGTPWVDPNA